MPIAVRRFYGLLDAANLLPAQGLARIIHEHKTRKLNYIFPYRIEGGALFDYGSYGDYWNPNLNGVLRTFDVYLGRTW